MDKKRDLFQIYGVILTAVSREEETRGRAVLTGVQFRSRIPFNRFKSHLEALKALGLVEGGGSQTYREVPLKLTEKGRKFIQLYGEILELLGWREVLQQV
ncbi:MAG: winged helix-turn-helix domain-containing protein [Candidatus Bathyarchaeia archaeon]